MTEHFLDGASLISIAKMTLAFAPFIFGVGAGAAQYQIARSQRLRGAASASLSRTFAAGDRTKWSYSTWLKKSTNGIAQVIISGGAAGGDTLWMGAWFDANDVIRIGGGSTFYLVTNRVFRDPAAWMHVLIAVDTSQATASNRVRLYINGLEETSVTRTNPNLNDALGINQAATHRLGFQSASVGITSYFDGYFANSQFVNGAQLTPSDFGAFDPVTGWGPKSYTGAYGTTGFFLDYSDNSAATSSAIGKDRSGNGNDWTPNNISVTAGATNDSLVDTPTNYGSDTGLGGEARGNYCTLNSVYPNGSAFGLSSGNLNWIRAGSSPTFISLPASQVITSGKFYGECKVGTVTNGIFGAGLVSSWADATSIGGAGTNAVSIQAIPANFNLSINSNTPIGIAIAPQSDADAILCAIDADAGRVWMGLYDASASTVYWFNNAGATTGDPSSGANPTWTYTPGLPITFGVSGYTMSGNPWSVNFGQRAFSVQAPVGFKAFCSQNQPDPVIKKPSLYFDVNTRVGTGAAFSVTGKAFPPDLVLSKGRSGATSNIIYDIVRGATKQLISDSTAVQTTESTGITSFNSDGFSGGALAALNTSAATYVDWLFKAGGAPSNNTAGSATVSQSANALAGISISTVASWPSAAWTMGHGLGVTPAMFIVKADKAGDHWFIWHRGLANAAQSYCYLNQTAAAGTSSTVWGNTAPTSSLIKIAGAADNIIADTGFTGMGYVISFAEVAGFSKFGTYTGNGSTDGPFVYCGFRPRFIMIKRTDSAANWQLFDTARDPFNAAKLSLFPNLSDAEVGGYAIDVLSNGFKSRAADAGYNASGGTYIFAAFPEAPFKYALAR